MMKCLLLILSLLQVSTSERISQAYDLHDQGLADSALVVLAPTSASAKDSAYYVARNLEAWIYMDKGDRASLGKGLDVLNQELPDVPFALTKSRMLSLRGYIQQALGNMEGYRVDQESSYAISKEIADTLGMSLALRNVYYYYSRRDGDQQQTAWFLRAMKDLDGDSLHTLRTMYVESYYEHKYGDRTKAIAMIARAMAYLPAGDERWLMDVAFAQATFLVADGNPRLAEKKLVHLLENDALSLSYSFQYRILARLVQIYVMTDRRELAKEALTAMDAMPSGSIDMYSIELGAYAKMAYTGARDARTMDPVFQEATEGGVNDWLVVVTVFAALGMLWATRRFTPPTPTSSSVWQKYY